MKLGVIGLPQSGKTTVFEALTQGAVGKGHKGDFRIATIPVPDERVDALQRIYKPQKTTFAQVEFCLPQRPARAKTETGYVSQMRECDALVHVVRNFGGYGFETPHPAHDFDTMAQELILADLVVIEKRLERIVLDQKRGKKPDQTEARLLDECRRHLEAERSLSKNPALALAPQLRGFAFVSAKPMLVLFNNEDEDEALPSIENIVEQEECLVIRGKLEQELAQMEAEEAREFLSEFNIAASAMDRVIRKSYKVLGQISFFTVVNEEVRAWTIKKGTEALDAAGTIHTDMQRGFIRAEVIAYNDLIRAGHYREAKKMGAVRLEGKDYVVRDGDVINFRFNI